MLLVTIPRKVVDLEAYRLKEAISQRVLRVQRKDARILPRLRGSLTNQRREQILKSLTTKDRDLKVRKTIKAIMNQINPSNRQVCAVLFH